MTSPTPDETRENDTKLISTMFLDSEDEELFLSPWAKRISISSPVFCLLVGPSQVSLFAHCDIVCKLPFFRAACKGQFKESKERTIKLPEDTPYSIGAILEFLYTGKCDLSLGYTSDKYCVAHIQRIIQITVATTKYGCLELEKQALEYFYVYFGRFGLDTASLEAEQYSFIVQAWKAIYSLTDASSPLRLKYTHGPAEDTGKWEQYGRSWGTYRAWLGPEIDIKNGEELKEAILCYPELGYDIFTIVCKQ